MVKQVLQTVYGSHIDPHRHCLKMLPVEIFWLFIELLLVTTCKVSAIPTIRPKEDFQSSLGDFSQILEAGLGHGSAKRHKTMSETGPENWQVSNLPPGNAFFPTYMPQVPFHDGLESDDPRSWNEDLSESIRKLKSLIEMDSTPNEGKSGVNPW
ncbi:hypothetical protein PCASD_20182 [Puccinia coronata f. sp. avenae]|uniref:Uncharacterized protein n=1 Tax=Puccinia coronata f. sp. avenae TaxID=200324 RepID=A0A2N5TMD9_9BASI|nr:hypothetical protein PCASD_20182 [Puccinia coronata f. sp. avenae]